MGTGPTGRPATVTAEMESRIVQATFHEKLINATHLRTRTLAEHLGVGKRTARSSDNTRLIRPRYQSHRQPQPPGGAE